MTEENKKLYDERWNRIKTAVALQEPDRIPFVPKIGTWAASGYGLNLYDHMKDARNIESCLKKFVEDYEPDMVHPIVTYPMDPCQLLGAKYVRFPGPESNIPLTASFQIIDDTYMQDDEFDEFLLDPTHFMLTKILPRKYSKLGGMKKLYGREIYELSVLAEMGTLADNQVQDCLRLLMMAGKLAKKRNEEMKHVFKFVEELGFPHRGGTVLAPFDAYADSLRGLVQATIDVVVFPEKTLECVNRIEQLNTKREIEAAKRREDKFVYMPLHAATDEFMSPKNYEKFYLPGLLRTIQGIIDAGLIPYVFCEGKYNTRLEMLRDGVPKGKTVFMFEQVDIAKTKKILGEKACICGNLSGSLLSQGKPERIVEETKKLIDICAPGGGFIMDCSTVIESATHENFAAWHDTTIKFSY